MPPTLACAVARHPYPDFQQWWPVGRSFLAMMADAILEQWTPLAPSPHSYAPVQTIIDEYIPLVYAREARPGLAADFGRAHALDTVRSGEFDALSYAFFRTAFESLARHCHVDQLRAERRRFTQRVGARFFARLAERLALDLPPSLDTESDLARLKTAIDQIGGFLHQQGYLRSHFAFRFDVTAAHAGRAIDQRETGLLRTLASGRAACALYEMGHPLILPSAVYLYQTIGEAQHHSSRTIEELFARVGCDAWETDHFDPSHYPSELVVELWRIRRRPATRAQTVTI